MVKNKSKLSEYIILSFILLIAVITRLYKINSPIADWHSFRQADTASVGRMFLKNGINILFPKYHDVSTTQSGLSNPEGYRFVELPLYSAIHVKMYLWFNDIPFDVWGRMVSVLSAIISTYILYLIGRKTISEEGGILTASFYALLPFNIFFTRVVLPEPLSIVCGLLGLLFYISFHENEKPLFLLISSMFFGLGILVKPYIIFYGLPVTGLWIKKYGFKGIIKNRNIFLALLIVFVPFVLWRKWIKQFPEGIPFWKWTFNGDGIRFRPSFWRWIFGERLGKLILGFWGLIPFAIGLIKGGRKKFVATCFLVGMFLYVLIIATANVRHDYYQTIVVPAVALILANGSLHMWNWSGDKAEKLSVRCLLIFSLAIAILSSFSEIKEFYKINNHAIIEAGQAVKNIIPESSLIIAPYNGDTAFLYQTGHRGWPVVDRPINELIEKGAEYFVSVDLNHYQTIEFTGKFEVIKRTDSYIIINLKNVSE